MTCCSHYGQRGTHASRRSVNVWKKTTAMIADTYTVQVDRMLRTKGVSKETKRQQPSRSPAQQ